MLSREQIINAVDLPELVMDVPEWGGSIKLRGITAGQMIDLSDVDKAQFAARLLAVSLVDETGSPLFAPGEIAVLMSKNHAVIQRLTAAAIKLNSMAAEDAEKK